ncbi:MAG: hypothetical protein COB98_06550 [Flavobacteriaceae bacterium]|nr:MAG: hypothetical protein COB98_06550 [Flavobacteriaceae bacterium]
MKKLFVLCLFCVNSLCSQENIRKDTTYAYLTETIVHTNILKAKKVESENKFYINSRSNDLVKGGKSRIILPIQIPKNTVRWYYEFTASRNESEVSNTINTFNLLSELSDYAEKEGLDTAVSKLTPPPGAHICDIYLVDKTNALLFRNKKEFNFDLDGSRENFKSGIVPVLTSKERTVYLAIKNPNNIYGIHVGIQVVALVQVTKSAKKAYRIPVITSSLKK